MSATIRAEHVLKHPPGRVWRALTDATLLGRWLMPTDFRAEVGATFTFDTGSWGIVRCEVTALEPERLLRYTWRNPPLDTVVTWTLAPEGEGTRLVLEHAGFDLDDPMQRFAYENMGKGWMGMVEGRFGRLLDELD